MNDHPLILLAGRDAGERIPAFLAAGFGVRLLTRDRRAAAFRASGVEVIEGSLSDPASIRRAAKRCSGAFAVPAAISEGANVIRVIAGSDVELLVIAAEEQRPALETYARELGLEPVFVAAETTTSAAEVFLRELGGTAARRRVQRFSTTDGSERPGPVQPDKRRS